MHCSDDQDLNRQEPRHIYHIPGTRFPPRGDSGLLPWQGKMVEISWGGRILGHLPWGHFSGSANFRRYHGPLSRRKGQGLSNAWPILGCLSRMLDATRTTSARS
jgi:hypothetical protein